MIELKLDISVLKRKSSEWQKEISVLKKEINVLKEKSLSFIQRTKHLLVNKTTYILQFEEMRDAVLNRKLGIWINFVIMRKCTLLKPALLQAAARCTKFYARVLWNLGWGEGAKKYG